MRIIIRMLHLAISRREKLAQDSTGLIVLSANIAIQRANDVPYPYRQDSSFWYYTGLNEPGVVLVIADGQEYLILPNKTEIESIFDGETDKAEIKKSSGIEQVYEHMTGWNILKGQLKKHKKVNTLLPRKQNGMANNPSKANLVTKIKHLGPGIEIQDITKQVARQRMIKTADEIELIQKSINITNQTIKEIFTGNWYEKYKNEAEIARDLHIGYLKRGASGHAFEPIVAGGKNACTIHYTKNNSPINKGNLLLIDTGAEYQNYAADISRTIPIGKPTPRQMDVIEAVTEVSTYAKTLMKPGALMKDIEKQVETKMGQALIALGLITKNEPKMVRKYYPHAVSHHLGLDVHDLADYSVPISENMVITVEPGIYIKEEGIGVRIEDDVMITKNGNKILSD